MIRIKRKAVLTACLCAATLVGMTGCGSLSKLPYMTFAQSKADTFVTLGEYTGLSVEVQQAEDVTDAAVLETIQKQLEPAVITEAAQLGDTVKITFTGTVDGKDFEGGSAEDYEVLLGSGSLIAGFEDKLVGLKTGEDITISVSFPEGSTPEELSGNIAKFQVTMGEIKRSPELTDARIAELTDDAYKTVAEYAATLKETMQSQTDDSNRSYVESAIRTKLKGTCVVSEVPEDLVNWCIERTVSDYQAGADKNSMTLDEYIQNETDGQVSSEAELRKQIVSSIQDELAGDMILYAISKEENISVSDEEYKDGLSAYATKYGYASVDDLTDDYEKSQIMDSMLIDKTMDFVIEQTDVQIQD